jgi:hypothetical protein
LGSDFLVPPSELFERHIYGVVSPSLYGNFGTGKSEPKNFWRHIYGAYSLPRVKCETQNSAQKTADKIGVRIYWVVALYKQ